ncbi:MAG: HD-GYP domain-containing protein [Chitinophagales bacterium]
MDTKWEMQLYIAAVSAWAAWLFGAALHQAPLAVSTHLPALLLLGAVIAVTRIVPIQIALETKLTVDTAVIFGSLLVAPLSVVLAAVALAVTASDVWLRRAWYNVLFNAAKLVVTAALVGFLMHRLGAGPLVDLPGLVPLVAAGGTFLLLEVTLVAGVISLHANVPFPDHCLRLLKTVWFPYSTLLMLGALASTLWVKAPVTLPLLAIPLALVHRSYQQQTALREQTRGTLIRLADTIDNRDVSTAGHCHRVAKLALDIAREMALPEEARETVFLAARLHDIGKIGIPVQTLLAEDDQDGEVRADLERHPAIGMVMLTDLDQFFDIKEAVVFHHKRYDGGGYPRDIALPSYGLPLSAGIIAVADEFDVLTSGRKGHSAFPEDLALREIQSGAGTRFHPEVVRALLSLKGWDSARTGALVGLDPHRAAFVKRA